MDQIIKLHSRGPAQTHEGILMYRGGKTRANRVLAEVKKAYKGYDALSEREMFIGEAGLTYDYPVVWWEAGPHDWAIDVAFKLNQKFRFEDVDIFVEPQTSKGLAVFKNSY